ncbi:OHCU decarboxylase [Scedosporium apiospermum]|uniref:OHCU decarboxylase n=1 Tax=Pseudallescheria apiosperma TaxID=563466 RepID=A0A084G0K4_PSEDA|nr:OHCU decarboxylase [Scedosporium apiospermum]KEZ40866.1 OHCU decarboxylase [Scedosporium apiospermum]
MATVAPARLPAISSLSGLSLAQQTEILDLLFEPSPSIHELLLPLFRKKGEFASYDDFITEAHAVFSTLRTDSSPTSSDEYPDARAKLHSILGSHPRLGAKKVESAQSAAEQAQLQSGDGSELAALNAEYEKTFPGLRYVVFVNGRPRPVIMENMRERIARGDISLEEQEGIQAMCDIARDRAAKLQRV